MGDAPKRKKGGEKMARRLAEELGTEVEVRPNVSLGKNEKKLEKCVKILRQLGLDVAGAEEREGGFLEPSGEPSGEEGKKNVGWTWHREEKGKGLVEKKPKVPLRNFDFGGQWEESRGDTPSDIYGSGFPRQEERLPRQDFYGRDLDSQPRVAVVVVRCDSHSRETPREELTRLFPPPFYRLKVARDKGEESEQERVSSALAWARENFPRLPVLLVKDSTVSNLPGELLEEKISLALDRAAGGDLCYLGRWGDKCQQQRRLRGKTSAGSKSTLHWTYGPEGLQAALFFPSGRDVVLGLRPGRRGEKFRGTGGAESFSALLSREIEEGNLKAACFSPNLVEYDLSLATRDEDFLRRNECLPVDRAKGKSGESPDLSTGDFTVPQLYVWIAILLFVVVVVALLVAIAR